MKKYTFLNFLYKKEVTEGFLTNLALAGALAGGDAGEIQDFNPQQLKISQEQIKQKYEISNDDSKIFAALKEKGMKDYYIDYFVSFYKRKQIALKDLNVFNKDIDFYRVLKSGSIVSVFDLNKMKKEKPMTKQEEEVLYDMANDLRNYLRNDAFGFSSTSQNKEIYLPNDLLKIIVFNEKYQLDNNTGLGAISKFLEKHKITWGDIDGMRKVMKNYYDVLENYKNRPM